MFPTRSELLLAPFARARDLVRHRPKTGLVLGFIAFALVGWTGVRAWGGYHLRAAETAWQEDRLDDARRHLESSVLIRPLESHLFAARMERLLGNFKEAETHLRECKKLQGVSPRIQLEWLLLRALQGELSSLEPALWETVKEGDPQTSLILETLAVCYLRELRYQAALHTLTELLQREPAHLRALDWRSWIREKLDNREGAQEDCNKALAVCPELWRVRLRLTWVLLAGHDPAAAEQIQLLQETHADVSEVQLALAQWQLLQGEFAQAQATVDALLASDPDYPPALLLRGKLEGNPRQAEKYFRHALKEDPLYNEALFCLYRSLQTQRRDREAKEVAARYQKNEKDRRRLVISFERFEKSPSSQHLAMIGESYLELGNVGYARRYLVKALEVDRGNRRAYEVLESLDKKAPAPSIRKPLNK
jgi:Tfp pilus assembly protein PilF